MFFEVLSHTAMFSTAGGGTSATNSLTSNQLIYLPQEST